MIEHTNIAHITNLEEAVSALYQKVFGFKLYITPADTPPQPAPVPNAYGPENDPDILRAQRDAWEGTAAARSHRIEDKNATIARLEAEAKERESYIEKEHVASWQKIQKALPPQPLDDATSLCDQVVQCIQGNAEWADACRRKDGDIDKLHSILDDKNTTIARLKDKLAVTAEVMQENIDLKAEAERLHTLWHEAQHALDLLRDHHKAAQEEINVYEACVKRNAEAMRRSRIAWAERQEDNRTLAAERDDYKNLWIEACDQLVKERNA